MVPPPPARHTQQQRSSALQWRPEQQGARAVGSTRDTQAGSIKGSDARKAAVSAVKVGHWERRLFSIE
jgi:hypothetical protein